MMTKSTKETILGVAAAAFIVLAFCLCLASYRANEPASDPYLQPGDNVTWARVAYVRHNSVKLMLWGDHPLYMELEDAQCNALVWRERVPLVWREIDDPHGNHVCYKFWLRNWPEINKMVYNTKELPIYDLHREWN